tara:strand:- start:356 stop:490 length:135 start_codon:yes stop_codon:yes gene_type:complete
MMVEMVQLEVEFMDQVEVVELLPLVQMELRLLVETEVLEHLMQF